MYGKTKVLRSHNIDNYPVRVLAAMCYRCQGFGHSLRDCKNPEARSDVRSCVRCGQRSCKASCQGDWYRFMEGCNRQYSKSDLKLVRCFVCGKTGHFCCKKTPEVRLQLPCF